MHYSVKEVGDFLVIWAFLSISLGSAGNEGEELLCSVLEPLCWESEVGDVAHCSALGLWLPAWVV